MLTPRLMHIKEPRIVASASWTRPHSCVALGFGALFATRCGCSVLSNNSNVATSALRLASRVCLAFPNKAMVETRQHEKLVWNARGCRHRPGHLLRRRAADVHCGSNSGHQPSFTLVFERERKYPATLSVSCPIGDPTSSAVTQRRPGLVRGSATPILVRARRNPGVKCRPYRCPAHKLVAPIRSTWANDQHPTLTVRIQI